ncbi:2Fe-2S iron-sulfur cluster-binding protein [Tundrisphaera sp. TA3]|uniref:2Fe-2S iron-sulfur cluster-binding protein n=1 Tax=Tundrisphaera sp. TA3 TaxID=3435775 RepID=UPI003EBF6FD1
MATLRFEGQPVATEPGETVLDALLRAGHAVPHACRAGACQSCLVRAVATPPPDGSQFGLNEGLKARGFFLACSARLSADLDVELGAGDLPRSRVRIAAIDRPGADILRVLLEPESPFEYRAGQFLTLIRDDGLARSYSIASVPGLDPALELHVRVLPEGRMGRWLAEEARPGDWATIQGPAGHCFYVPGQPDQEIILAGTGTGLAPLYGIARDAIQNGHSGPITLFHGARDPSGLYLDGPLRDLERQHSGFRYIPCCLDPGDRPDIRAGRLEAVMHGEFPGYAGRRVYLCGNPAMVQALRKQVFLKGAKVKEIFVDAFLASPASK